MTSPIDTAELAKRLSEATRDVTGEPLDLDQRPDLYVADIIPAALVLSRIDEPGVLESALDAHDELLDVDAIATAIRNALKGGSS